MTRDTYQQRLLNASLGICYAKSHAPQCDSVFHTRFRIYKHRLIWQHLQRVLLLRQEPSPLKILDVGCLDGSDLDDLICRQTNHWSRGDAVRGWEISGIDCNEHALQCAQLRFGALQQAYHLGRVGFLACDLSKGIPLRDGAFDVIVCSEVIEHMEEPSDLLRELYRVLEPQGFLILTTPNEPNFLSVVKRALLKTIGRYVESAAERYARSRDGESDVITMGGSTLRVYGHINAKTCLAWEALLRQAGFDIVRTGPYDAVARSDIGSHPLFELVAAAGRGAVSLAPTALAKRLADTTAVLCRKP